MKNALNIPIRYLKGIGPKKAKVFNRLEIDTIEDLLYYFPRRYEDRTNFIPISKLQEGQAYTVKAKVLAKGERRSFWRRGFSIIEVVAGDPTGKISCIWFNQPYLADYFKVGQTLILYAKIERYTGKLQMNSPEFEIVSGEGGDSLNIGRIVPIYACPSGITQRNLRQIIKQALDDYLPNLNDFIPFDIRSRNNLLNLAKSLITIHFPDNFDTQKEAYKRLSFEEFFLFQLPLALRKSQKKGMPGITHQVEGQLPEVFIKGLPFTLTEAQKRVIDEIKFDMAKPFAMQRLLQGDVGSGKTVVATLASLIAMQGGYQAAFMVPTEILARQHYEKISCQWFDKLTLPRTIPSAFEGLSVLSSQIKEIKIGLLTSSATEKEKKKIYQGIKEGKIDLLIGTHALLEESVEFKNLGLVIIDEQHKFGVGQRALLPKKGLNPDCLIMTATPIPRTLAITIYGDLDISVINEAPPGRLPVKTMRFKKEQRSQAYQIAKGELNKGHQAYIIYPVIEESYALDIAGAKQMYEQLKSAELKEFKLGLIHGRLKQREQDRLMSEFQDKKIDILVSTTVLEVGIDIPNATCMIIEQAERFGLAQLHQLRGRVGRGKDESFCILISSANTQESGVRLEAMIKYNDGFRIAEEDLKVSGPGEFFGKRQHGLSELRVANPLTQLQLLKKAREEAIRLVQEDPKLGLRQNLALKEKLLQRFPGYEKLMIVE